MPNPHASFIRARNHFSNIQAHSKWLTLLYPSNFRKTFLFAQYHSKHWSFSKFQYLVSIFNPIILWFTLNQFKSIDFSTLAHSSTESSKMCKLLNGYLLEKVNSQYYFFQILIRSVLFDYFPIFIMLFYNHLLLIWILIQFFTNFSQLFLFSIH